MLLNLNQAGVPMKLVFQLSEKLKNCPEEIELTQALTLNEAKPRMGLKGTYGLFGSEEWWENIQQRKMPLLFLSGTICRTYIAGQDESDTINSFDLLLDDGSIRDESIYVNNEKDVELFCTGHRVEVVYAMDELKLQPAWDGGINYLDIALEMAVSLQPVK